MSRFVEGEDRRQPTLLPSCLDDYIDEDNAARVIDAFVDELDLGELGFVIAPAATGRPAYHPATLLKLYVYGYLNRVPSSRRLEREAQRNVELMWLPSTMNTLMPASCSRRRRSTKKSPALRLRRSPSKTSPAKMTKRHSSAIARSMRLSKA